MLCRSKSPIVVFGLIKIGKSMGSRCVSEALGLFIYLLIWLAGYYIHVLPWRFRIDEEGAQGRKRMEFLV